jgi:hypothetical protein
MSVETYHKRVTAGKHWSAEAIATAAAAQGIALAPGRAERLARAQAALLEAAAADPLLATLDFDADPARFAYILAQPL